MSGLSVSNTAVFLGIIVSGCVILGFLGACIGFAFRLMRKLAVIEELPAAVESVRQELRRFGESNAQWREDHLRFDHGSGRMRRRDN